MSEFKCMNSCLNSCWCFHDNEIIYEFIIIHSCVNSVLWRISWNHGWIPGNEFTYESMVEFINLEVFRIQFLIYFSEGKCLLIQSNHHSFFAVSSLQALRLLCGCCSVETRRRCFDSRGLVLSTTEQRGCGGPCNQMLDVTGVEINWACLSARKETLETIKLRDYQRDQPQGHKPDEVIRSLGGFQAGEGRW